MSSTRIYILRKPKLPNATKPPTPDLGSMVADGRQFLPEMWWGVLAPGFAIFYATLGFNLLGDGLRDMFDVEV